MVTKVRNLAFTALGAVGLLLKGHYAGPGEEIVRSYGGNIAASFAVYFVVSNLPLGLRSRRVLAAALAVATVELFEASNGFGVMANVYDASDFVANAMGVALAVVVDVAAASITGRSSKEAEQDVSAMRG